MPTERVPPISVRETVPAFYIFTLSTLEPLLTLAGVAGTIADPRTYLMALGGPTVPPLDPRLQFLYTQLCGAWLAMAFNGGILLRLVDNRRVWTLVAGGMLLSDLVYSHSCAQAMGGWSEFVNIAQWRAMDWIVFLTSAPLGLIRLLFLMKVGFTAPADGVKKSR